MKALLLTLSVLLASAPAQAHLIRVPRSGVFFSTGDITVRTVKIEIPAHFSDGPEFYTWTVSKTRGRTLRLQISAELHAALQADLTLRGDRRAIIHVVRGYGQQWIVGGRQVGRRAATLIDAETFQTYGVQWSRLSRTQKTRFLALKRAREQADLNAYRRERSAELREAIAETEEQLSALRSDLERLGSPGVDDCSEDLRSIESEETEIDAVRRF